MTIHLNIRPVSCDACDKKFRYQQEMRLHYLRVHCNVDPRTEAYDDVGDDDGGRGDGSCKLDDDIGARGGDDTDSWAQIFGRADV